MQVGPKVVNGRAAFDACEMSVDLQYFTADHDNAFVASMVGVNKMLNYKRCQTEGGFQFLLNVTGRFGNTNDVLASGAEQWFGDTIVRAPV